MNLFLKYNYDLTPTNSDRHTLTMIINEEFERLTSKITELQQKREGIIELKDKLKLYSIEKNKSFRSVSHQ